MERMRILPILSSAVAMLVVTAAAVMGEDADPLSLMRVSDDAPSWSVSAGAVILHRSNARPATLVVDATSGAELANVADFDLGSAAGPRIDLTRAFDNGWELGVVYFGIDGWSAARSLHSPDNLLVPLVSTSEEDTFSDASAVYSSRLYNTEINLKRRCGDRLRLLAGFRWVELHESIAAAVEGDQLYGTFAARTDNYLYGFQLGTEATLWNAGGPLSIEGFLKAGIFGNHTRAGLVIDGTNFHLDGTATHARTSFLGEIGLTANYRLTDHCTIFGGYEVMWIDGVSLAGDTVAALERFDGSILINGHAFYHGALAGVNFTW